MELARPTLRGVSHRYTFFVAIAAGAALIATTQASAATAIYAVALAGLFGISSTYHGHGHMGTLRARLRWMRADHAMIFIFIAASYTPIALIGVGGETGAQLVRWAWIGAGLGALQALLWPNAPRAVTTTLYVALGWAMIWCWPAVHAALAPTALVLFLAGGGFYTLGAIIYALRRPDPLPMVFGYHEVFHALVIAGSACHFVTIWTLVR